ncbi:MAG: PadR family transcriptional regulator [Planctomycetota bacterium]|jgi:DNA-binding PadR family transcriptional regulator
MSANLLEKIGAEIRRGIIQIAALSLLRQRMYGYQLVKVLAESGLETEEGTLYPLLRRLESQGLLTSEWDTAGSRPRKYYVLSAAGETALGQLESVWREVSNAVGTILDRRPTPAGKEQ